MLTSLSRFKSFVKEAWSLPGLSLFLIPLVHFPFFTMSFLQGKELTFKVLGLLAYGALLVTFYRKKKVEGHALTDSPLFLLLLAALGIHAVTDFLSNNPMVAMYGTFTRGEGFIFELYLFAFLVWTALFTTREKLSTAFKVFWVSMLLVAFYGLLQKMGIELFFQSYSVNLFQGRIFSLVGNPSLLGQLMLLGVILGAYLTVQEKKWPYLLGTLLMLIVLVWSGTRSAALGLIAVAFLTALRYRKEIWGLVKKWNLKLLALVPILLLGLWLAPSDRFDLTSLSLRSLNSRLEIWKGTMELISRHPLLGNGQETFYIYFPEVVTKEFLTLEEDLNISADRVHNELLETIYEHGALGGLVYLALLGYALKLFFTREKKETVLLATLILGNTIQNQLSFPDPTLLVATSFVWGALVALESKEMQLPPLRRPFVVTGFILLALVAFQTVVRPVVANRYYTLYPRAESYEEGVEDLKAALTWTPYYSQLWFDLMMVDPSSMGRALENLEVLDGESGDVLAWKGNYYAESDPVLAADYFIAALEKNPYHPNWLRAFGDMLYEQGDCETALYIYSQYIEAVPDYWKWSVDLDSYTSAQQKSYDTFFKHAPYFFGTLEKMEACTAKRSDSMAQ